MLVTRQDILLLKKWSITTDVVAIDSVPNAFKTDFQSYFFGKTLLKKNNVLFAYPHDIKKWIFFMLNKYNG